jgi:hypothetical protein
VSAAATGYAWAEDDPRLDAFCLSALTGVAVEQVLDAFSARPETEARAAFAESFNDFPSSTYVLVDETSGGVLVAESNGWWGVQEAILRKASRGGRMASCYRSVNADMLFALAVDGSVEAQFDPLLEEVPDPLREAASGLRFDVSTTASSLALVELLTGVRLEQGWIEDAHRRFDVPAPV